MDLRLRSAALLPLLVQLACSGSGSGALSDSLAAADATVDSDAPDAALEESQPDAALDGDPALDATLVEERDAGGSDAAQDAGDGDVPDGATCARGPTPIRGALVNTSFEAPLLTGGFLTVTPGSEPAEFGWSVVVNGVDVVRQGWSTGAGVLSAPAADGNQYLDTVGVGSTGALEQGLAVPPGLPFRLSFAYANNPAAAGGATPASAHVGVHDCTGEIAGSDVTHDTSTFTDLDWRRADVFFTSAEGAVVIRIETTDGRLGAGLLIDDVRVISAAE